MSGTFLLDANALIALVIVEHEHHARATAWCAEADSIAVCPITEGAMVRYLIRAGESATTVSQLLAALHASERADFWPDSLSYAAVALGHVSGHRQVTDSYLAALAASRGTRLATFDQALAVTRPEHTVLID